MYFITTLRICGKIIDDCRTIGMSSSYGDAFHQTLRNTYDMFECGYYQYAVITFIDEGIYPSATEQQWFIYDKETQTVKEIDRPQEIGEAKLYIIG